MKINPELRTTKELDAMPCSALDTEDRLVLKEYSVAINSALDEILPNEAAIIRVRHLGGGISYRQLASRIGFATLGNLLPRSGFVQRLSSPAAMERSGIAVRVQRLVIFAFL